VNKITIALCFGVIFSPSFPYNVTRGSWFVERIYVSECLCHSDAFPRHARLLAIFFLLGWRPAPERDRAATAIMLRRFGFFVLLRLAIVVLLLVK